MEQIIKIPLEQLQEHKHNKDYFRPVTGDDFELLCNSIAAVGIIHPIVVIKNSTKDEAYTILSGHQRVRAACEIGLPELPCIIAPEIEEENQNEKQLELLLNANLGRRLSLAEKYRLAAHIMERQESWQGHRSDLDTTSAEVRQKSRRDEIAQQAGITKDDITLLNKIKKLPPTDQTEFYDWLDSENPNRRTIQKRLKQALEQNRKYKAADKELNQLKRKARLARELQTAAEQIQSPEDYRAGEAIEQLRCELATIRVSCSESFGRLKAIPIPDSPIVHNWVQREAQELAQILQTQAQQLLAYFGQQAESEL